MNLSRLPYIHRFLLKNWWVIVFIVMAGAIYLQAYHNKHMLVKYLKSKVERLSTEQALALKEREELIVRKKSWGDPDSVELILKEKLGLVAEGEQKVIFE